MGRYLGSWKLEDIIYVPVVTHSVTTGAATDSDAAPTWRLYEDSNATPVTTGTFSVFDTANSAGLAIAAITLASAAGYEKGKSYSLYVQATVASVIGADVHSFQIEAEVDANAVSITVNSHVASVSAGSFQSITVGSVAGTVNANVSSITAGAISANAFTAGALQGLTLGTLLGSVTVNGTAASAIAALVTSTSIGAVTVGATAASAIAALVTTVSVNATSQAAIVDGVWAETSSGYTTAGSMGYVLSQADSVNAIRDAVWNATKASYTNAGTFGELLDVTVSGISGGAGDTTVSPTAAAAIADAVWDEARSGHVGAGSFGEGIASVQGNVTGSVASVTGAVTLGSTSNAAIAAAITAGSIGAVTVGSTSAAAIQSGLATGANLATVDTVVDAIKLKTDLIFAGTGNSIAADIRWVNGVSVTGNGQSGTEWGPGS